MPSGAQSRIALHQSTNTTDTSTHHITQHTRTPHNQSYTLERPAATAADPGKEEEGPRCFPRERRAPQMKTEWASTQSHYVLFSKKINYCVRTQT